MLSSRVLVARLAHVDAIYSRLTAWLTAVRDWLRGDLHMHIHIHMRMHMHMHMYIIYVHAHAHHMHMHIHMHRRRQIWAQIYRGSALKTRVAATMRWRMQRKKPCK